MQSKNLVFRMTEGRKPISWQLPLSNVMLPRLDEKTNQWIDKLVHYLPGSASIFMEDYKGDKKGEDIWFEDGEIEVRPTDALKIEILKRHPWFNIHFELVDDDSSAEKELQGFELQEKALSLIEESDPLKQQAIALVLIGQQAFTWSSIKCKAELKKKAFAEPKEVMSEFNKPNFQARYIVGLAMLKKIITTDRSNTAVVWADTQQTILRIAVGESAVDKLSDFLSVNTEESIITFQRLSELAENTKDNFDSEPVAAKVIQLEGNSATLLADKDKEIENLKALLASKSTQEDAVKTFVIPDTLKEEGNNEGDGEDNDPGEPLTLAQLQEKYVALFANPVPNLKKNDAKWLLNKIEEFQNAQK
ncbi:hypothetical protein [Flavobacterium sp.]|uniref:hypothetical protein n=1 Tax=Flavobacterium sp. TaxID=239 RepID=UPI003D6C6C19